VGFAEVSNVLWRERELLELLLFKLEEEQLLLASGRNRWLSHATREVEFVLAQIREAELLRSVELEQLRATVGTSSELSLSTLAEVSPPPWSDLFRTHRQAFLSLTNEITTMAEANRDLLSSGVRSVTDALLDVGGVTGTYSASGRSPVPGQYGGRLVDRAF
jgi:FlgN protein